MYYVFTAYNEDIRIICSKRIKYQIGSYVEYIDKKCIYEFRSERYFDPGWVYFID